MSSYIEQRPDRPFLTVLSTAFRPFVLHSSISVSFKLPQFLLVIQALFTEALVVVTRIKAAEQEQSRVEVLGTG
jgi:hypothetical protein